MLPIVTEECYFSLAQSLKEEGKTNFTEETFNLIIKENPVLAKALNNMLKDAMIDPDEESRFGKLINTICVVYRLLRSQDEADEMNKKM